MELEEPLILAARHPLLARVSPSTVRRYCREGRLRAVRIGGRVFVTDAAVREFLAACNGAKIPKRNRTKTVSLAVLETRLEQLPVEIPGHSVELWGRVCQHVAPELYGRGVSRKPCNARPGTAAARWRLSERARAGLDLHHPRDGQKEGVKLHA